MNAMQCRMARAALNWTTRKLQQEADVPGRELQVFLRGGKLREAYIARLQRSFEKHGLAFIEEGQGRGAGVQLRKPVAGGADHPKPTGPATDAVDRMEAEIEADRARGASKVLPNPFGDARADDLQALAADIERTNWVNASSLLKNASPVVSGVLQWIEADEAVTSAAHLALRGVATFAEHLDRVGARVTQSDVDRLRQAARASVTSLQAILRERARPNDRAAPDGPGSRAG